MNILYLNNEMTVGGVTKCILKLTKELNEYNNIFIASKEEGALLDEFSNLGIQNIPLIDVENKSPYSIIRNVNRLIKVVRKEKIDIIHSHHRMTTLIAKIVALITGVKVIHTQHLCIADKFKLTHVALKNIPTITVSESAKRILIEKSHLNENNITTIYNTIELENRDKTIDETLIQLKNNGYFVVAQVSRAIDYKGVYDFIEIAEKTTKNSEKIRFVFIGDGPDLENMKQIVEERNLGNYINLLGNKNNVIEQLKYIDLFLLCSYIEGLPLSPLEAFSQKIPVIATNIDGTNEEIINDYNGYLIAPKDIDSFVNHIQYLYSSKEKYLEMKENAFNYFNKNFNKDIYISNHFNLYQNILNNARNE